MDPAVQAEFAELTAAFDGGAEWEAVVAAFGEYLHQGFGLDPWSEVARLIESCVEAGRPGSFIRLGDGEGNVLALALDEYPALAEHCAANDLDPPPGLARAAARRGWTSCSRRTRSTLRNATVIGFPGPFGARMMMRRSSNPRPAQGLIAVHRYLTSYAARARARVEDRGARPAFTAACCRTTSGSFAAGRWGS